MVAIFQAGALHATEMATLTPDSAGVSERTDYQCASPCSRAKPGRAVAVPSWSGRQLRHVSDRVDANGKPGHRALVEWETAGAAAEEERPQP